MGRQPVAKSSATQCSESPEEVCLQRSGRVIAKHTVPQKGKSALVGILYFRVWKSEGALIAWTRKGSQGFNSSCSREKMWFDRWGFLTAASLWCHPFTDNNVSNLWKVTKERNTQVARFLQFPHLELFSTKTIGFFYFLCSQSFYVNSSILQVYISWAPWQSGSVLSVMEACPFAAENRDTCHCWNRALHSISNLPKTICHIPRWSHNNRNKLNYSPVAACHKQNGENEILIFPRLAW